MLDAKKKAGKQLFSLSMLILSDNFYTVVFNPCFSTYTVCIPLHLRQLGKSRFFYAESQIIFKTQRVLDAAATSTSAFM